MDIEPRVPSQLKPDGTICSAFATLKARFSPSAILTSRQISARHEWVSAEFIPPVVVRARLQIVGASAELTMEDSQVSNR
jgi:hypothetical protein